MSAAAILTEIQGFEETVLKIPNHYFFQLVFRQELAEPVEVRAVEGIQFRFCANFREYIKHFGLLRRCVGLKESLKGCLKILTGRRMFYFVADECQILHYAWITLSHCRFYYIDAGAAVIGPIWTAPACAAAVLPRSLPSRP